ncbi:MAG: hypothetical protein EOP05_01450 [Proteobacteria bacterium]|nr:MAG: hypothetical protein EOP05_01450 [Pseudomonadota bacterium]
MRLVALAILGLFINAPQSFAGVGFIQVYISNPNSAHTTVAEIYANGAKIGSFSHSQGGSRAYALEPRHLSQGAKATPIRSSYMNLQQGCQFDFSLAYGPSPNGPWISLGKFHAPQNGVQAAIPIGTCSDGFVCSDNAVIQNQLIVIRKEQERQKRNADFEERKRKFFEVIENAKARARSANLKLSVIAKEKTPPEPSDPGDKIKDLMEQPTEPEAAEPDQVAALSNDQVESAVAAAGAAIEASEWRIAAAGPVGMEGNHLAESWKTINENLKSSAYVLNQAIGQTCVANQTSDVCDGLIREKFAIEQRRQMLPDFKDATAQSSAFIARFIPGLNDALDFCEAATGREFCKDGGRTLNGFERGLAAVGMIAGDGLLYRKLAQQFPWLKNLVSESIIKQTASWNAKAVEHIYLGNLSHTPEGLRLAGGLHTRAGYEVAQARTGFKALQEHRLANGVTILELPPGMFTRDGRVQSLGAAKEAGFANPIKSLFPENWSDESIAKSINEAAEHGRVVSVKQWGEVRIHHVNGVDIQVNISNGKVTSGFPALQCKVDCNAP